MLGPQLNGKPNKQFYYLGFGCLLISELDATTGLPDDYRQLGNVPEFTTSVDIEELEHRTVCEGLNVIDDRIILSQTLNLNLTVEEINNENAQIFFQAGSANPANPAVAGVTNVALTSAVAQGVYYELRDSSNVRIMDLQQASDVSLRYDLGGTPTAVPTSEYEVDLDHGLVYMKTGSVTYTPGEALDFSVAANAGALAQIGQLSALTQTAKDYALKFLGLNGRDNSVFEIEFHSVRLNADGDFSLINPEELSTLSLAGVAQINTKWVNSSSQTMTISRPAAN